MLAQQRLVRLEELERLQLVAALLEPLHDVADQATLHPVRLNHDVRALHLHRGRSGARRGVAQRRGADTERHAKLGESEHGQGSDWKGKKQTECFLFETTFVVCSLSRFLTTTGHRHWRQHKSLFLSLWRHRDRGDCR